MSDLIIPEFLRVDRAESARRLAWNATHPIAKIDFSGETEAARRERDEAQARMKAENLELERQWHEAQEERKREKARAAAPKQYSAPAKGMIWSALRARYVAPNYMSPSNYARLLAEMPTEKHRLLFIKLHGSGHGASVSAGGSPVSTANHAKGETAPSGAASLRSAQKSAGRVRVPSETAAASTFKSASTQPTSKPRATAGWKSGVIAMLSRPEGATLAEIGAAYGWQEHSASARLTGLRKEGHNIIATVEERGRVYRMEKAA